MDKKHIIYDIETFPNCFTFCAVYSNGKGIRVYEISERKDETEMLLEFLRNVKKHEYTLVGFNNTGFDYPVIHYLLDKSKKAKQSGKSLSVTANELYRVANDIISNMKEGGFGGNIRSEEVIIPQMDLYKIHHFDNKARSTSLKMLEFNMRSDNIEDLPFPVGKTLTNDEIDVLIAYNKHDVMQTLKFYNASTEAIALREELSVQYGFDCTNFNDTKIGKELFIRTLEKTSPGSCYVQTKRGRQLRQTKRNKIVIKNCLFDYISFDRPEFKAVHEWFKRQVITETKGVFSDQLEHDLGDVAKYAQMVVKRKKLNDPNDPKNKRYEPTQDVLDDLKAQYPLGWIEEKELKSPKGAKSYYWCWNVAETLNVVIDGFRYDYGVGGIHGAKQGVIESTDKRKIRTLDVASYYPNMAIANNVYPEHLGLTFCKVYKDLYNQRKQHAKGTAANAALKLALNGTYGDSNNEYSPLYDPAYTMTITIGGQLSLCMLMEKLIDHCGAEIIMCNTDGFEYMVDIDKFEDADKWVKWWETLTGLTMEGDSYSKMIIRDVNNYISVYENGNIKRKGAYEYDGLGWHQNQSALVVAKAAEHELLGRGGVDEFILNHEDKWDFMLRTKVPRNSRLVLSLEDGTDVLQQNICRYYPSEEGGKLVKIMPPLKDGGEERRLSIDKEWSVKTCNDVNDFEWDKLNYEYYIVQAKKLVDIFGNLENSEENA